jgi:hypothetical protein
MSQARSSRGSLRRTGRLLALAAGAPGCLVLSGCAALPWWPGGSAGGREAACAPLEVTLRDAELYRQAQGERIQTLEREIRRLRADLGEAEGAMVAIESGLRGAQTRADAVSALAEARISVERARTSTPWRSAELAEVSSKLEEAERQFQAGNVGSAVFFASRAKRIADSLREEAQRIASAKGTHVVTAPRVNLRAGPSTTDTVIGHLDEETPVLPQRSEGEWVLVRTPDGTAGWVRADLLEQR